MNDECRRYLEQGFRPYFLCGPSFETDGFAFLIFCKEDDKGYWRMIRSNNYAAFHSSGGGSHIIYNLINSTLDLYMGPGLSNVLCLDVSKEEWKKLDNLCWYDKGMDGYYRFANHKATDIYEYRFLRAQNRAYVQG